MSVEFLRQEKNGRRVESSRVNRIEEMFLTLINFNFSQVSNREKERIGNQPFALPSPVIIGGWSSM